MCCQDRSLTRLYSSEPPQLPPINDVSRTTSMAQGDDFFGAQTIPYDVARGRHISTRLASSPIGRTGNTLGLLLFGRDGC